MECGEQDSETWMPSVTSKGISHYCEDVHKTAYELNQWEVNYIDTLSRRVGDSKAMVQSVTERVAACSTTLVRNKTR
jgi:hypothetical protein